MSTKELIIVAGPNGAGKSTYALQFVAEHPCPYLSADAIAAELAPHDPTSQRIAAGREFFFRVGRQLAESVTFLVETTLSGRTFHRVIERAKAGGFSITIAFVYLDTADACVARVQERVRKGGHDVPEAEVRRRFTRSFANFWHEYRRIADFWHVIYNSGREFQQIAFGEADKMTVRDESAFRRFLQLAG